MSFLPKVEAELEHSGRQCSLIETIQCFFVVVLFCFCLFVSLLMPGSVLDGGAVRKSVMLLKLTINFLS